VPEETEVYLGHGVKRQVKSQKSKGKSQKYERRNF
jgi:hypothetical protein